MRAAIGIDRKIRRAWLDTMVDHLADAESQSDLRTMLEAEIQKDLPGPVSRAKTTRIILRIWGHVPARCVPLRRSALELLPQITLDERLWLHWGMTTLAYPFFRDVVGVVGRLLAAKYEVTTAQVEERMRQRWGDWTRTTEATRRMLHTLVDWDVLGPAKKRGHFLAKAKLATSSTALQLWLLEALLWASPSSEVECGQLARLPEAFPFKTKVKAAVLRNHGHFYVHRRALETDVVSIEVARSLKRFQPANRSRRSATPAKSRRQSPNTQSAECHDLLREGRFPECIARAQVLIEAAIERAWQARVNPAQAKFREFHDNLKSLCAVGVVSIELKNRLTVLWIERNEYIHLSSTDDTGRKRLQEIAEKIVQMLIEVERTLAQSCCGAVNC